LAINAPSNPESDTPIVRMPAITSERTAEVRRYWRSAPISNEGSMVRMLICLVA
jgi:hypothetical protein